MSAVAALDLVDQKRGGAITFEHEHRVRLGHLQRRNAAGPKREGGEYSIEARELIANPQAEATQLLAERSR